MEQDLQGGRGQAPPIIGDRSGGKQRWLEDKDITEESLFRRILHTAAPGEPLLPEWVSEILKRVAVFLGFKDKDAGQEADAPSGWAQHRLWWPWADSCGSAA